MWCLLWQKLNQQSSRWVLPLTNGQTALSTCLKTLSSRYVDLSVRFCTVSQSSHFYFCDYLVKCWPILYNIWHYCSWENLQPNDIFLSHKIQFMYEYYRIVKQERSCMLSMLPLHLAVMPVSCSFLKSLFSTCSPQPLFRNSLQSFFATSQCSTLVRTLL